MKARIKATGEIVDVEKTILKGVECYIQITEKKIGSIYMEYDLDFGFDCNCELDYWTRLEHTYAGMAMQALIIDASYAGNEGSKYLVEECTIIAHALVEKLKEKEV